MADLTLAVAESHRAPHQTGASHRPKTRVLESGGQRREDSLNPIVARVRAELIALAAEHSNRPEVVKYAPNQPRDDHGRWTSGGDGPTVESLATQNVTVKNLEAVDPALRQVVLDAAQAFRDRFPPVPLMVQVTPAEGREIASAQGFGLNLSPEWYGPGAVERWAVMAPRDRAANWSAEPSPRGTIEHEFGHIIDWMVYHDASDKAFRNAPRYSDTGSGRSEPSERWAEGFSQLWLRPKDEWTPDARIVAKALLAPDVADNIGEQPGKTVYKYDPSQPREPAGSPEGGEFASDVGDHEVATPTTIKEAMVYWTEGSNATRASIAAGKPDATAQLLLAALAQQKDGNAPKLYRGLTLPGSVLEGWGVKVDQNWSSPGQHANALANQASFGQGAAGTQAWSTAYEDANAAYAAGGTAEDAEAAASASVGRPLHATSETAKASAEPGGQFDMNLSSFTPRASYAAGFASGFSGAAAPGEPVVLQLERGATALRLTEQAITLNEPEREWLTAGRFEVVDAKYANFSTPDYGTQRYLRVTIRQVGKLESTAEKFDPSQPRDDHGRWTADDREALEQYGMTSDYLNEQLKEGVPLDTQPRFPLNWSNDELVRQIDGAFSRAKPTSELLTMFRGVGSGEVDALVPGATLTYPGYVSTTPSRDVAATYGRVVPVIIPAGSRVIDVDAATGLTTFETETLLPRGSTFRYDESGLTFVPDAAEKYDKDQARVPAGSADGGQWTADTSVFGVTFASVTAIDNAVRAYSAAHPDTEITDSLLRGRPDFIIPALEQLGRLQDQFPRVKVGWVGMQATGTGVFGGSEGGATIAVHMPGQTVPRTPEQQAEYERLNTLMGFPIVPGDGTSGSSIFLNERYFGADAPDSAFWTPQFGYHPPGIDEAAGIMTHEFGHAVEHTMNEAADLWTDRKTMAWSDWRDDAARRYANPEMGGSLATISTYARIGGFREAVADLFAAAYSPGTLPYDPKGPPMTARSRLNAETQGYVDTMRSVLADSGATVTKVVKYSESQPRDERGRWTSTGASASEQVDMGDHVSYRQSDGTLTRWPDLSTAFEEYAAAHPRTNISRLDEENLKPVEVMTALDQLDQLQRRFPAVNISAVKPVDYMQVSGGRDTHSAWCHTDKDEGGTPRSEIWLNKTFWGEGGKPLYGAESGWSARGTENPQGIMTHEFGHAVQKYLQSDPGIRTAGWEDLTYDQKEARNNITAGQTYHADLNNHAASGYGLTGLDENFAEWFAWGYHNADNPPKATAEYRSEMDRLAPVLKEGMFVAMPKLVAQADEAGMAVSRNRAPGDWRLKPYWSVDPLVRVPVEGAEWLKVEKFDPSQPRDEAGRWTATGMAAAEADPTGAGYQWPDGTVTRWPDLKTAKAEYQKAHPDTLLYLGRLDRVKSVETMAALDQLDKVQQQFPGVRISEVAIRKDKYENKGTTVASCRQQGVGSASAISLNPAYWAVGGKSLNGYDRGWHPDGVSNPAGYMTHEFGHAVDNYYSTAEPADDREERERVGHWKDMAWDFARPDGRPISGYARTRTNSASVTAEGFAEAFAEAFTPGTPGADQPNALALKDLLATYGGYVAKVDFFTEGGAVHPIRGSEGYDPVLAGDIDRPATGQYSITSAPYLQTSSYDQVCETCHQTIPAGTAFMRGDWTGGLATFEWHVDHDPVGEWKPEGSGDYSANPAQRELDARTDAPADRTSPFTPEPPSQLRLSADERTLAVENLNRGAAKFARNGGTVEATSSVHKQWEAYAKFQEMTGGGLAGSELGPSFARTALESGDDVVNIAWTKEGDIAGAHAYDRTERPTELQQLGGDHSLGHGIVGSTGVIPGVGSALTAAYIRHAASENASIVIAPVASAKTFWRSMGMRQLDGGGWGMSADDAKAIAAALD